MTETRNPEDDWMQKAWMKESTDNIKGIVTKHYNNNILYSSILSLICATGSAFSFYTARKGYSIARDIDSTGNLPENFDLTNLVANASWSVGIGTLALVGATLFGGTILKNIRRKRDYLEADKRNFSLEDKV